MIFNLQYHLARAMLLYANAPAPTARAEQQVAGSWNHEANKKEIIMAKKAGREKIILQSTESTYRQCTTRNKQKHPDRLTLRKYDPILRRHTLFKEVR